MFAKPMLAPPMATEFFREQRPRWDIRVALMVPCMIYFGAGLNFTSSQDRAVGDALTATAADPSAHRAAVIIAAPFVAWICMKFGSLLLNTLRGNLALLLLLIWAALSIVWSQDRIHTLSEAVTLVGTTLIVIWMAQTIDWQSQLKIILWAGAISGILSVAFAIGLPSRGIDYEHGGAWQGIFFSKNHLGRMMLFFLTPAFYFRAGQNQTLLNRAFRYSYIALCLGLIAMSRSKTAIAVTAIYLVFTAAMFLSRRLRAMDRKFLILALCGSLLCLRAGDSAEFDSVGSGNGRRPYAHRAHCHLESVTHIFLEAPVDGLWVWGILGSGRGLGCFHAYLWRHALYCFLCAQRLHRCTASARRRRSGPGSCHGSQGHLYRPARTWRRAVRTRRVVLRHCVCLGHLQR